VTNNFALNSRFRFATRAGRPSYEAPRFLIVSVMGFLLSLSVLEVGIATLGVPKLLAQAVAIGVPTPVNFVGNKVWTFGGGRAHAR
jgi:putative flippase GtrA